MLTGFMLPRNEAFHPVPNLAHEDGFRAMFCAEVVV